MNIGFNFQGVAHPILPPIPGGFGVAFLPGGGFTITIPPNAGINLTVTAVGGGNAEVAVGVGVGGGNDEMDVGGNDEMDVGVGVGGGNAAAMAAITAGIEQHAIDNILSVSQVMHLLMFHPTLQLNEIVLDRRVEGLYLYPMALLSRRDGHNYDHHRRITLTLQSGGIVRIVKYRHSIAVHPNGNPLNVIVARRYAIVAGGHAGGQFLVHYRTEDVDEAELEDDDDHPIPDDPEIDLGHLQHG